MIEHRSTLPALLLVLAVFLSGCAGDGDLPVLRLALQTEPTTLDPAAAVDYSSGMLSSLIHSNLVRFDEDGLIVPDLAGSWDVSGDGLTYTFTLSRQFFSNGRRVVAGDVVYSFRRLLDRATVSPRWWVLEPVRGAGAFHGGGDFDTASIGARDDSTVVIVLERPAGHFLSLLSMPAAGIVCRERADSLGREYGRHPCGSGPWKLSRWSSGDEIVLDRNPYGAEANESVESISFRIIPESMTRIAEFEVGNLDILEVPRAELERWRTAGSGLLHAEELRVVYIGLNNTRKPFSDPRVRRAVNMAVDVEMIIAKVLFGAGVKARGPVPPALGVGIDQGDLYPYDPGKAISLLREAGYPDGFEIEIWQRENPEGGRILESIQGYLSQVGISVKIVTREWSAFKQAVDKGTPDAFYLDWFADYPDAGNFLVPLFHSSNRGGKGNRCGFSDLTVDSLLDAASSAEDADSRIEIYNAADEMIYGEAPWLFLWFPVRYEVVSPRLEGYRIPVIFNATRYLDIRLNGRR